MMIAESKKTGRQVEFTLEQWRNFENTGHAKNWRIIDVGIIDKKVDFVVDFSKDIRPEPVTLTVDYKLDYRKLLDEAGIKYNKNIKNEAKLKEIYEQNK